METLLTVAICIVLAAILGSLLAAAVWVAMAGTTSTVDLDERPTLDVQNHRGDS